LAASSQEIEAGADFVITQLFFDNADFFEFRETDDEPARREGPLGAGHHSDSERFANQTVYCLVWGAHPCFGGGET